MRFRKRSRREFLRMAAMTVTGTIAGACESQTVVVKRTVEVEKETVKKTVIVEKEVTRVVEKEVVVVPAAKPGELRVGIPASRDVDGMLQEAVERAAEELGVPVGVEFMPAGANMYNSYCKLLWFTDLSPFDVFFPEAFAALQTADRFGLPTLPDDAARGLSPYLSPENLYQPGNRAFSNADGLFGIAQSTAPLMLICNPERLEELGVDWPQIETIDQFIDLGDQACLAIPPNYGRIGIVLLQSIIGREFSEDLLTSLTLVDHVSEEIDERVTGFLQSTCAFPPDKVDLFGLFEKFWGGEIAWMVHDSSSLVWLAQNGYEGRVAAMPLPIVNSPSGLALGRGWVVSPSSPNQELAWELIAKLVKDPAVVQWSLARGMLPISHSGFDLLIKDENSRALLPMSLLDDDPELSGLRELAAQSTLWRVPAYVNPDKYNELLLQESDELVRQVTVGEMAFRDAVGKWAELAQSSIL